MFNKLIYRLLLISLLFVLSPTQQVLAADKSVEATVVSVNMTEKINVNTANSNQLAVIKGLGKKKAQAIVDYRQQNGDFVSLGDLIKVKGIGKSTLQKIEPFVTL
ncbi:MAG: competence protein ComEA [Oleiphilaceae bacterium]|jgi:competence protein ComEA